MLDTDPDTLLRVAAAAGFDGVGLRLSAGHAVDDPAALGERARVQGLIVHDIEVYRIAADALNPEPLLDAAAAAGARRVLVVSDLPDRSATVEALHALAVQCGVRGLRLGLEYMAWTNPSSPSAAIDIADEVGCELLVDVLHHERVGAGVADLDAIVDAGRLGWVQLCDAPLAPPDGPFPAALLHEARHARLPPGRGGLPLDRLLARVPAGTTFSVEVQSDELLGVAPAERARLLHDSARSVLHGPDQSPRSTG